MDQIFIRNLVTQHFVRGFDKNAIFHVLIAGYTKFRLSKKSRSSHWGCAIKKGVLKNFTKFTGKQLCGSLFLSKVAGLRAKACNFIEKETPTQMFSCEICEIFENTFFYRTTPGDCFLKSLTVRSK